MIKRLFIGFAFLVFPSLASANCVVGATGVVGTGTCSTAGSIVIATLIASGTTNNLSFFAPNWSSAYNVLRLRCSSLIIDGNNIIQVQVGETPVWETSANYTVSSVVTNTAGNGSAGNTVNNATDLLGTTWKGGGTATTPTTIDLELDNVASTTAPKLATWRMGTFHSPPYLYDIYGHSFWAGDNNAINNLRVIVSAGLILSGQCTLYGEGS